VIVPREIFGALQHRRQLAKLITDKYDISQNTGTIPVEQKQHYDKYDIAQNTGTIPVEQKQHYDKYDIVQNT
jgi:hypothetical protein